MSFLRTAPLVLAAALLVGTRASGSGTVWEYLAIAGGLALTGLALLSLLPNASGRLRKPAYLLALGLIVVPTPPEAWLAFAPAWAVALVFVLALHMFVRDEAGTAPEVESARHVRSWRHTLRYLPAALATGALVAAPLAYEVLLPQRIHAAYELRTALAPLVPLAFVATFFLVIGALHTITGKAIRFERRTQKDAARSADAVQGDAP